MQPNSCYETLRFFVTTAMAQIFCLKQGKMAVSNGKKSIKNSKNARTLQEFLTIMLLYAQPKHNSLFIFRFSIYLVALKAYLVSFEPVCTASHSKKHYNLFGYS